MKADDVFDFIVIGAGSAGSVVAGRLSEANAGSICVLEAGGHDRHLAIHVPAAVVYALNDPRMDWRFKTEPSPGTGGRALVQSRGKVLGGTGAINGHIYTRGHRTDYRDWQALGNPGWGYDDVLSFFKRNERRIGAGDDAYRGRTGPFAVTDPDETHPLCDAFMDAAESIGIKRNADYNGAVQEGISYVQRSVHRGRRVSPARAFLLPVRKRGNTDIRTHALVRRLILEGNRVAGVCYQRDGRDHVVRARREVILSAGSVGSPHILQLSGIGAPDDVKPCGVTVRQALQGVGANLQDHYAARMVLDIQGVRTINERSHGMALAWEALRYLATRKGALALTPTLVYCFAKSDPWLERGDLQISFTPASYPGGIWTGLDRFPGATMACWQQRPYSRGYVRLRSGDFRDAPIIQPNYLQDERDQAAIVEAMKLARKIAAAQPFARHVLRERWPGAECQTDAGLLEHARNTGNSTYHLIGTCKMGPVSDKMAVVGADLKLHGLEGLRIADASIMPSMPAANTNAPSLMIGERAADFILTCG